MRALEPIIALTILFCVYAAGELIAQKTKAVFSTVLGIAILLLAGFWSGILPRSVIEDAQVTGFGNVIAGILIVSLGTTIDFPELRRQWKVVVTSLVCVVGATLAIILIGYPLIGKEMALSVAPIFAGGSAATLIMTTALDEMGLVTASTLCIVMYVVQKFIGVPIASLLLRPAVTEFTAQWMEIVKQNYNHPCIITWTPFNESWGISRIKTRKDQQHFTEAIYYLTKSLDKTRPVIVNDGWEHTVSDIITLHDYEASGDILKARYSQGRDRILQSALYHNKDRSAFADGYEYRGQPVIISEFGGIAFDNGESGWGYGDKVDTKEAFVQRFDSITTAIKELSYVCGFCYTQVTDVQQEINGLMDMERNFKVEPEIIREINMRKVGCENSHVILVCHNGTPTDEQIAAAAESAAYFSRSRHSSKVEVDCTLVRNVKKPARAVPGYVIFDNQTTYIVEPKDRRQDT